MRELDDTAREAVETYRGEVSPDDALADRNWERIAARIADGEEPLEIDDADRRGRPLVWAGVAAVAVAAAVTLAWSVDVVSLVTELGRGDEAGEFSAPATLERSGADGTATKRTPRRETPATPTPVSIPEEPVAEEPVAEEPVEAPAEEARPRAKRVPKAKTPGTDVASVRAEMQLIRRAQVALRDGDPARALGLVARHARDFRDGELAEERDVLRMSATCELGRGDEARSLARAFLAERSRSPLAARVRRICTQPGQK